MGLQLRFTLSTLTHLKRLSISVLITRYDWVLPEIIRVVNTARAIPDVVLRFNCHVSNSITLARLDWSPLDRLEPDFTGKRRCVTLCVIDRGRTPEGILDALVANEVLMDLVKRSLVIIDLRSECTSD